MGQSKRLCSLTSYGFDEVGKLGLFTGYLDALWKIKMQWISFWAIVTDLEVRKAAKMKVLNCLRTEWRHKNNKGQRNH